MVQPTVSGCGKWLTSAGLLLLAAATGAGQPAGAQPAADAIRQRLEEIHATPRPAIRGAPLQRADAVVHFFEARAFAPVWRIPEHVDQIRQAIHGIDADGLTPADYHLTAIDALLPPQPARADVAHADLQILLTDAVAALVDHVRFGKVLPVTLDRRWNVDPRDGAPPLDRVLADIAAAPSPAAAIEALKPNHFIYTGLKGALAALRDVARRGGWPAVTAGAALKPGAVDPRVRLVRQRLIAAGAIAGHAPADAASETYDADLEAAVKHFQDHHRLTPDGIIGAATVQALNVSATARADQVRVNLERARWVVNGLSDSFVFVNLPSFKVYLIRGRKNVWEARTQIGRAARQTPTFRAELRYLVLNPDWTVPPTILAQDVLGGMRRGENTIARKGLTILDRQGRRVDPSAIDWSAAEARNFPYTLRQPPGKDNALGRVKFVFPNEHSIFLHDTPSQELFAADQRTFSSGCIRVEHALDLAAVLLAPDGWTPDRIQQVLDGRRSETVFLGEPLQILIVYWTVSVGATGEVRFARDVYNRDPRVLRALVQSGSPVVR